MKVALSYEAFKFSEVSRMRPLLEYKEQKRREAAEKVKELMKAVNEKHKRIYRPAKEFIDTKPIIIDRRLYTIQEVPEFTFEH